MRTFSYIFFALALLYLSPSCGVNRNYKSKPAKNVASADESVPEINALAYHLNDSVTEVYVDIKNENLLYRRPDTSKAFYADVRVLYKLMDGTQNKKLLDTSSFQVIDHSETELVTSKSLQVRFKIKAKAGSNYHLELETLDKNKKTRYVSELTIVKASLFTPQSCLITLRDTVVYKNYFITGEEVKVKFSNSLLKKVAVECFLKEFNPAAPPFSTGASNEQKYKPDSVFILELSTNQFVLKMPAKGFYYVRANGTGGEGLLSVFAYNNSFPGLGSSIEMINSTRYIMERSEYENCVDAPEQKAAIDKFWLTLGGSNERARELIKRYYGRVTEANKQFTSYAQGWKSDRGMIYIVFGSPTNLYKSKRDEIWVYGNEANPASLRFVFNKTQNPFSDNDFILERSQFYKEAWYSAVDYWRQGNVYLDSKR